MSKPVVVSIPHHLGKEEARRRLETGFSRLQQQFGAQIASIDQRWEGDRMDFKVGAMGQTVAGNLEVMADAVRIELVLPWILAVMAEKARGFIQKQGTLMLEKK
jgi:putative polyhydroxyalkanoate system protein